MTIWPRSSEIARMTLRCLRARVSWRMADNGRFETRTVPLDSQQSLLQNSRSGLPNGPPSGLGSSHFLPGFRRRLPKGFPSSLGSLTSSHTSEEDYPRDFLQASEVSQTSEEEYPRAFLQALEVSHPPILPKKTTQGSDYSSSGGSRVLMMVFSNSAIPTAPRCIKGLPSIGMKRREGIERIPNRAASSFSSSTLTL